MIAMGLTVAMVIGLTIFAIQTKWDFTIFGGFLFVALIIFTITGIVAIFVRSFYLQLAISCIGVILFSIYLICKYFLFLFFCNCCMTTLIQMFLVFRRYTADCWR